ncbi:MAG TPA: hypothetical protein VK589_22010 [Chryseolinea sp.]|nr:hypothetical protein [Chryseolinea sp.]
MKVFRIKYVINALTLFTGVIFLNMSFIFAEISALKVDQDKQMARNLSILVASSAAEEEPGGAADEDSTVSELDLIFSHPSIPGSITDFNNGINYNIWSHGHPRLAEYEICNPPPEA